MIHFDLLYAYIY